MRYVIAGYIVVLTILFLYGVLLMWRRRRLVRTVERVTSASAMPNAEPPIAGQTS